MGKNVMKLLKPSPHRARNDFDLSHRHLLDANFGELLPVSFIETVPGDNITLHVSDLIRNIPMVTSPFLRAKQHLDVWYVPYHDLWHNFDAFMTKKSEPVSSAFLFSDYCPHTDLYELYQSYYDAVNDPLGEATDVVGRGISKRTPYLMELFGFGKINSPGASGAPYPALNLFRPAAYNFIWYNEYRQQYYDRGTRLLPNPNTENPALLFNFDDMYCDTEASAKLGQSKRLIAMMQMRYRCWKKDLFTGLLPSTQFGAVSTILGDLQSSAVRLWNSPNIVSSESGDSWQTDSNGNVYLFDQSTNKGLLQLRNSDGNVNKPYFDVLALRKSEAIQIWRENALRAGNHIKDNMIAHYGVASDFQDHRPTYLGSVDAPLNISDVMTTANSSAGVNDTVGDIAGKGLSSLSEKVFKFHAKDFGVIVVMFSMLPEGEYSATGIDRMNQLLEPEDFFVPEYENLGLEGVSSFTFGNAWRPGSYGSVIGYAPRYFGYKTKLDKVFGSFIGNGIFAPWASQRLDVEATLQNNPNIPMPLSLLYVNPAVYNQNFTVSIDNSPQFLCDLYFDVPGVRPMSVSGLPFS